MHPSRRLGAACRHRIVAVALIVALWATSGVGPNAAAPGGSTFGSGNLLFLPDWSALGGQAVEELGYWVAGAGDVNGDGGGDIVAGAFLYDGGETNAGRAPVWHGSAAGLPEYSV